MNGVGRETGRRLEGRLKMEKWKKSGSREDVSNKKREEKGWDDGVGGGGWRCVRCRPVKPEGRELAGGDCGAGMKRMAAGGVMLCKE